MKLTLIAGLLLASIGLNGCANTIAQEPQSPNVLLNGHYVWQGQGQYWGGGQDGSLALPPNVPAYISKNLYDSGTFEADGEGHATQCGAGAWGTWTTPVNCTTHWTADFNLGQDQWGNPINQRFGMITSDAGDKATIACTATGKHCVMTSHGVGWSWTQILDKE